MYLIDEIHLKTAFGWRVLDVVQQVAGFIHLGARGGVYFDEVDKTSFVEFATGAAHATGPAANPRLAVEAFGKHARQRGFAHAASAGEQISMVEAPGVQRVRQGTQDMALPDDLAEITRPPFSGEDLISHLTRARRLSRRLGGSPASHTSAPAVTVTAASFRI